jgi:PucR C-terminal helix-turn-helix domain/GAF domain/GGDEF-like domain
MAAHSAPARDDDTLLAVVRTVGSSLELDDVLDSVVRLLTDASGVHACFVYLVDAEAERLVLKAASHPYSHLVDGVVLERGEGLAWWAIEHGQPAFIPENALEDPRNKHVPELEEERFQSLVSVPITARDGTPIGAITLHTVAPREFTQPEVDVLVSTALLVAGAIENARLFEETRRRVGELEALIELGETVAAAESLDELLPGAARRGRDLLGAEACHVYLLEPANEELHLRASAPAGAAARPTIGLSELGPELARRGRTATVTVPLVAGDELLGLLVAEGTSELDLGRAGATQVALALKKVELIERLTEKNRIKDFFEELAAGHAPPGIDGRATRLGVDVDRPHLVLVASPADDALEAGIKRVAPRALFDRRDDSLRALLPVRPNGAPELVEQLRLVAADGDPRPAIGISNPCAGAAAFAAGFEEARHALLGAAVIGSGAGAMTYEELGPYKYLLRMSLDADVRDSHRDAVARLAEYDAQRSTSLLRTLEEFLGRRGNISATAEALYVHPNTLRQRLRRIMELSGLDLRRDDWLMVEIAVKLVRLQQALGTAGPDTIAPSRL